MSDDLVAWLREQLAEDQRVAKAATPGPWRAVEMYTDCYYVESVNGGHANVASESSSGDLETGDAHHIARHDPARVLAEVAAKRRIIDLHGPIGPSAGTEDKVVCNACGPEEDIGFRVETYGRGWPCQTLRLYASVYRGRPGWRSEWAPDEEATP